MQTRSIIWRALVTFVLVAASVTSGSAQEGSIIPTARALEDADGDWVPDRLGQTVTVQGVVTLGGVQFGNEGALAYIQDATGGLPLYGEPPSMLLPLELGDSVRVHGAVAQFRGAEHLIVQNLEHLGEGKLPEPQHVLATEVKGERLSHQLVQLAGELHVGGGESGWAHAELEDRSGRIPVMVPQSLLTDPDFVRRLDRGGSVELVGIVAQSTAAQPANDGYYLFARNRGDFTFAPVPPYGAIGAAALALLFLGLIGWRWSAVRRARELESLSEELERSRGQLQEREALLRSLVENAADTVSVLAADGSIVYQSPSVQRMLGWDPDDLTGRPFQHFVHPTDRGLVETFLQELSTDDGGRREVEVRFRSREGSWRKLEVVGTSRLHDPAVRGIVCNARDITAHRALEERVRQADRMEVVGRLAGGIAHDFNNLLTALRGHAELALAELPHDVVGREDVEEVVRASNRASALTRQLLAFSRQQVLKPAVVRPTVIVREMLPMIGRLIGENIELDTKLPGKTAPIRVDPAQFEQVLMNLVVNARDAMPDGGRLMLELGDDHLTDADWEGGPEKEACGPCVRLTVSDNGAGMTEEVQTHIFEPFYTTKEQGKGTGLGLATLYGIVKQSGGHVHVRSAVGEGTRFDIFFPAVEAETAQEEEEEPRAPVASPATDRDDDPRGRVVLLVEDETAVRRLARRVLEKHDYQVLEAATPTAALEIASRTDGRIDLLLTDVVMPEMSGPEMAEAMRRNGTDLPTLYTSGYTDDDVIRHGVVAGEARFIEKPFTPNELIQAVRSAMAEA